MVFCSHLQSKHMDSGTSPARLDAAPSCQQPKGFVHRPHGGKRPGYSSAAPSESSSWACLSPSTTFPIKSWGRFSALSLCLQVSWDQGTRKICVMLQSGDQNRHSKVPSLPVESRGYCRDTAKHGTAAGQRHLQPLGRPEETPSKGWASPPARLALSIPLLCVMQPSRQG